MGSVTSVVELASLRRSLIEAVERGIRRIDPSAEGVDRAGVVDEHATVAGAEQPPTGAISRPFRI